MVSDNCSKFTDVSMLLEKFLEPGISRDDGVYSGVGGRRHVDSGFECMKLGMIFFCQNLTNTYIP